MTSTQPNISTGFTELTEPPKAAAVSNADLILGPLIPPIDRVRQFSPDQFEDYIYEWAFACLKNKYAKTISAGGAGDKGRDIQAYITDYQGEWDNYQCKHYKSPLSPSLIRIELAKLCHNCFTKKIRRPRKFYFVAPLDLGPSLTDYLTDPTKFRDELLQNWDKHCSQELIKGIKIDLTPDLKQFIENFDFSIIDYIPQIQIIEELQKTPHFKFRFGGGLQRPPPLADPLPSVPQPHETRYVEQLIDAYREHSNDTALTIDSLSTHAKLKGHFDRSRTSFYLAESLERFGRDTLLEEAHFKNLQEEIYLGIVDTIENTKGDGYLRVIAATNAAALLQISGGVFRDLAGVGHRHGVCHQLANEDRIQWADK